MTDFAPYVKALKDAERLVAESKAEIARLEGELKKARKEIARLVGDDGQLPIRLDSMNHYQLVRGGNFMELYEYGPECPLLGDKDYTGRRMMCRLFPSLEHSWEFLLGGERRVTVAAPNQLFSDGEIVCGDDFIHQLLMLNENS